MFLFLLFLEEVFFFFQKQNKTTQNQKAWEASAKSSLPHNKAFLPWVLPFLFYQRVGFFFFTPSKLFLKENSIIRRKINEFSGLVILTQGIWLPLVCGTGLQGCLGVSLLYQVSLDPSRNQWSRNQARELKTQRGEGLGLGSQQRLTLWYMNSCPMALFLLLVTFSHGH